jgi:hypothetical protein
VDSAYDWATALDVRLAESEGPAAGHRRV